MRKFFAEEKVNDKEFRENRSVYLKRHEVVGSKFFKIVPYVGYATLNYLFE